MSQDAARRARANRRVGFAIGGLFFSMLALSFAAVPLYELFCAKTGFGGRPMTADAAPQTLGARVMRVRFDSNVAPGLPWRFESETQAIDLVPGETKTVFYKVTNESDRETVGVASYNVAPDRVGAWFSKIACFCFTEQTLAPGESRDMPVVFFLDPGLEADESMKGVTDLTLSYTFFPVKAQKAAEPVRGAPTGAKG
jgi:cytochrome c oxidase assembly protein subunit 11